MIRISAGGKLQLSSHTCQPPVICYHWMVPFPEYIPCNLLQWCYSISHDLFVKQYSTVNYHLLYRTLSFLFSILFSFSLNFWSLSWHTTYLGNHLGFLESWSLEELLCLFICVSSRSSLLCYML